MSSSDQGPNRGRVAVVGAGPAGLFAAETILEMTELGVDLFDSLPMPFGLLRYGVAPDHPRVKSVTDALRHTLEDRRSRFYGNVRVGTDITVQDLLLSHDAVFCATGAAIGRPLGIVGEERERSWTAAQFVDWYNGRPGIEFTDPLEGVRSVAVVGAGNVSLDVTRMLTMAPSLLGDTDVTSDVLAAFEASTVRDVHVVIRRGPHECRFSPGELQRLGELDDVDIHVRPEDLARSREMSEGMTLSRAAATNLKILTELAGRPPAGARRRIHFHFWRQPVRVEGDESDLSVITETTHAERHEDVEASLQVQLVISAAGYLNDGGLGLRLDAANGSISNLGSRVLDEDDVVIPGVYVTGWAKRGSSGVIGATRLDARETVTAYLEDRGANTDAVRPSDGVEATLLERKIRFTTWADWLLMEREEFERGRQSGRQRVKTANIGELIR